MEAVFGAMKNKARVPLFFFVWSRGLLGTHFGLARLP